MMRIRIFQKFLFLCIFGLKSLVFGVLDSELFPYNENLGNTRFDFGDDGRIQVNFLRAPFRLFNKTHWSTHISGNGVMAFGSGSVEIKNAADCVASPNDHQYIMGFSSDADNRRDTSYAKLLYKETADESYLEKAKRDILVGFPELRRKLKLTWMFVVTWKNLPRHGNENSLFYRNTFQVSLASDGTRSFLLMYYPRLEWSSGNGWAVGIDFGNSRRMFTFPGSCTSTAFRNITQESNIGKEHPGKYVYRVDADLEIPSPKRSRKVMENQELFFQPKIVSVMGNVPLVVRNIPIEASSNVSCQFQDPSRTRPTTTEGIVVEATATAAAVVICPVPFLYSLGMVQVNLLVTFESGAPSYFKGFIFVVKEYEVENSLPKIFINRTMENAMLLSAEWDPSSIRMDLLKEIDSNSSDPGSDQRCQQQSSHESLDIVLLEYNGMDWRELGKVTPTILNNGVHLSPLNLTALNMLTKGSKKPLPRTFALRGKYTLKSGKEVYTLLPSNVLIGTDLITAGMQSIQPAKNAKPELEENIFDSTCNAWYKSEKRNPPADTLPCPATITQAQKDWRFMTDNAPHLEVFNPGTASSFIQSLPSASGAGSQCTYDSSGNLLVGQPGAGRLHFHSTNNRKNYWWHYWKDILPFMYCCRWSALKSSNCPSYYFDKRPLSSSLGYISPQPARLTGTSHFSTFKGLNYTLAGAGGEFWAVKSADSDPLYGHPNEFQCQVRLQQLQTTTQFNAEEEEAETEPTISGSSHSRVVSQPSILTSVVIQDVTNGNSVKVQATMSSSSGISVLLEKEPINVKEVDDVDDSDQDAAAAYLENFNLYQDGVLIHVKSKQEIIITFASGNSVLLMSSGGTLHMIITSIFDQPNSFEGLLNGFNSDEANENQTTDDFHKLGMKWSIQQNDSLFHYPSGESYADHNPVSAQNTAAVIYTLNKSAVQDREFCAGFEECNYDYFVTNNLELAEGGKGAFSLYNDISLLASTSIYQCKIPEIAHGSIQISTIALGSNLTVACDSRYKIHPNLSNATFTCKNIDQNQTPTWENTASNEVMNSPICQPEASITTPIVRTTPPTTKAAPIITTKATTRNSPSTSPSTTTTRQQTLFFPSTSISIPIKVPKVVSLDASTVSSTADTQHSTEEGLAVTGLPMIASKPEPNSNEGGSSTLTISVICIIIGLAIIVAVVAKFSLCKPSALYNFRLSRTRNRSGSGIIYSNDRGSVDLDL